MRHLIKKPKFWWIFFGLIIFSSLLAIGSCGRRSAIKQERGGTAEAASMTYVAPGDIDEYYLFYSGGHSGNVYVAGVPSMRHISTIPVFAKYPATGYGFDKESKEMLGGFEWGDVHHPALSETKGDYDGRWLFVNDNGNNRIARIDLRDFKTKQILGPVPNISGFHGGSFTTPNTEYILGASRFSIPLPKGTAAPIEEYATQYKGVVSGIFAASGQSCQAGSRLLLQRSIHERFVGMLVDFMRDVRLGDPALPDTQMGPIATRPQFDKVVSYIELGKREGATCVLGGGVRRDLGAGWFVEPTIFTGVRNDMRIAQEEIFGPVLAVIPFADEQDAIRIGNDIRFGLAAAVWTRDLRRAMLVTDKLKAGTIWVNNYRATSFTSPFGGYKDSGIGRESGIDAIHEYVETKCVWISTDLDVPNPFIRR